MTRVAALPPEWSVHGYSREGVPPYFYGKLSIFQRFTEFSVGKILFVLELAVDSSLQRSLQARFRTAQIPFPVAADSTAPVSIVRLPESITCKPVERFLPNEINNLRDKELHAPLDTGREAGAQRAVLRAYEGGMAIYLVVPMDWDGFGGPGGRV